MSLAGLAATRGSTITTDTLARSQNTDGSFNTTPSDAATGVQVLLEPIAAEIAQQLWGQETKATWRAVDPAGTAAIAIGQGLTVTAGKYQGKTFRVVELLHRQVSPGTTHLELGLEETDETF